MGPRADGKELWIGMVEVRRGPTAKALSGAKGAFVNMITWASSVAEFESRIPIVLNDLGLFVVGVENAEPIRNRGSKGDFSDDVEDMLERAETHPDAIIYGTFHTYKHDDA